MKEKVSQRQQLAQMGWNLISLFAGITFFHAVALIIRAIAVAKPGSLPVLENLTHGNLILLTAFVIPMLALGLHSAYIFWGRLRNFLLLVLCLIVIVILGWTLSAGISIWDSAPALLVMFIAVAIIIIRFLRNDAVLWVKLLILVLALTGIAMTWFGRHDIAGVNWSFSGMLLVTLFTLLALMSTRIVSKETKV